MLSAMKIAHKSFIVVSITIHYCFQIMLHFNFKGNTKTFSSDKNILLEIINETCIYVHEDIKAGRNFFQNMITVILCVNQSDLLYFLSLYLATVTSNLTDKVLPCPWHIHTICMNIQLRYLYFFYKFFTIKIDRIKF